MKKLILKMGTIIIYIITLLSLVSFKMWVLFNIKIILMVIFGTALLTLSSYKKGNSLKELRNPARWNAQVTGYLTTFVMVFSRLSRKVNDTNLMYDVALSFRPMFYGFLINILLNSKTLDIQDMGSIPQIDIDSNQLHSRLRESGLTDREIEIADNIYKGYSNKEIGLKLFISESTVKKHTSNLFKKLDITNREQLKQFLNQWYK